MYVSVHVRAGGIQLDGDVVLRFSRLIVLCINMRDQCAEVLAKQKFLGCCIDLGPDAWSAELGSVSRRP
jgi:hypothetical protein